jgi:hypothetical protein
MNYPESVVKWMAERQVCNTSEWRVAAQKTPSLLSAQAILRRRTEVAALLSDPFSNKLKSAVSADDDVYLYVDGKMSHEEFRAFQMAKHCER